MLFLADENIPGQVIHSLRELGHDVAAAAETLRGWDDPDVLAASNAEGRILITEDQGFGDLVVRRGHSVAGLIVLELRRMSSVAYAERAVAAISVSLDRLEGAILIVEPGRLRSRPIQSS